MDRISRRRDEEEVVKVETESVILEGELEVPEGAEGVVLFAHGSGSGRHSPRNQHVARELRAGGLATLLMDLLTREEEAVDMRTHHLRFDIELLAGRLVDATDWLRDNPETAGLNIGYFGASTGAAAALVAATRRPNDVKAIVSRGGRPDLAKDYLADVKAPTLLIVGGNDLLVINFNQAAMSRMRTERRLELIPGAGHLFEEPGALQEVARLARDWFVRYLTSGEPSS
ncbi:MAG: alpha/beta hydrolase [Anaerolineae bacterium]|nr:alpha/beta hydrolase [Anaerolineae bacterium]